MPLYMLAIQNAAPYNVLGAATSAAAFFRSIGGSFGLAVFGSVMNNRFAAALITRLPADVTKLIPSQQLEALMRSPQVLINPEAMTQLQQTIGNLGEPGVTILAQIMQALRESLALSVSHVFLYAFLAVVLAFIINFFIKEIPLRTQHVMSKEQVVRK
jgi:hypothetical protein